MSKYLITLLSCIGLFLQGPAEASTSEKNKIEKTSEVKKFQKIGELVRIIDGDTFIVKITNNDRTKKEEVIRLWGIDAPELDQPGGEEAKNFLKNRMLLYSYNPHYNPFDDSPNAVKEEINVMIFIRWTSRDRDNRIIGKVSLIGRNGQLEDLSTEMVNNGKAWYYKKVINDKKLEEVHLNAVKNKHGMWRDKYDHIEPWLWRKMEKEVKEKYLSEQKEKIEKIKKAEEDESDIPIEDY